MPRGFTKTATGFRAWVRIASKRDDFDELCTKRFQPAATSQEIRDWRSATRDTLRADLETRRRRRAALAGGPSSGFRSDAVYRYLPAVQAMPSYDQRVKDIMVWVEEFGDRDRHSIKSHEIRATRDRWLTVGPKRKMQKVNGKGQWIEVPEPLSASSVNHRLRALSNLYTVLDGRHARNPVRDDVPEADEPNPVPRAFDYQTIRQILDAMSDQGLGLKGEKRRPYSLAKVRARVLAWTGIEPKELKALEPADIHWDDKFLLVPARRKGRGAPGRIVPLGPEALEALRDFDRLKAYGRFNQRNVLRAWHKASRAVLGRPARLKDLRHSFVTGIVRATGNLATAQLLAGHTDPRTTRRYALAAMLPMLRAGIDATFPDAEKEKPQ